jgi:acyl-CoA synthetase (AMP-forming)/AMP-acid ligase II
MSVAPEAAQATPAAEWSWLAGHFRAVAQREPSATAVYLGEEVFTWNELVAAADAIVEALGSCGMETKTRVGWLARNGISAVAAALGVLSSERCLCPLNPHDPPQVLAAEIRRQQFAAVIGDIREWTEDVVQAVTDIGAVGVSLGGTSPLTVQLHVPSKGAHPDPATVVHVLERVSSGTTGPPKRVPVTAATLIKAMELALGPQASMASGHSRSPTFICVPFAHAAGTWAVATAFFSGRPIVLFEKFAVQSWLQAVQRLRPKTATLVPTMINMLLQAAPPREALQSLLCLRTGTAPLDPATKREFEARFGIPILVDYGAAEFIGGIAGWSLKDYERWRSQKAGAVGRIRPDVQIRILDTETGAELGAGDVGVLAIRSERFGADWIRTTDLASYDEDRFLYLHGRSDEAIIRGGFKILPEKVCEILREHAAVQDVCVLAVKDERLGQAALAVIEMKPGIAPPDAESLQIFARERLAAYLVPSYFEVVSELPRTLALKVSRPALRQQFGAKYRFVLPGEAAT